MGWVRYRGFAVAALASADARAEEVGFFLGDVASVARLASAGGSPLCEVRLRRGGRFRLVGREAARFLRE